MRAVALGVLACLLAGPPAALAQDEPPPQGVDEQAQRLADEAVEAYRTARYDAAVRLFKQAYDLRQDPAILYNLAKCYERLGQGQSALEYYRRYLVAEGTDARLRQKAEERVAALAAPAPRPAAPAQTAPPPRPGRLFFYSGVALGAAGVAGLVAGAALFGAAKAQHDAFTSSTDEVEKRAARAQARPLGQGSVAAYVVGGALLGGGAALLGLAAWKGFFRSERARRAALVPVPGGALLVGAF